MHAADTNILIYLLLNYCWSVIQASTRGIASYSTPCFQSIDSLCFKFFLQATHTHTHTHTPEPTGPHTQTIFSHTPSHKMYSNLLSCTELTVRRPLGRWAARPNIWHCVRHWLHTWLHLVFLLDLSAATVQFQVQVSLFSVRLLWNMHSS